MLIEAYKGLFSGNPSSLLLRTICYARNVSGHKLSNNCVNLMSIFCPPVYILKCMYICICGRNNGCRNNGSSELWAIGIMTRNPMELLWLEGQF